MKKLSELMQENRFLVRPFVALLLIYLLGISAILLSGVHYADDVARTNLGYAGWVTFSRYLNTLLSFGLYADTYLANLAPLPQILAVGVLAAASLALICLVSGKEVFQEKWIRWIWQVVAVIPLGLCPYMLECLSYQYDAPYMMLSVLAAVAPFLVWKKGWRWWVPAMVLGILVACTTYQASVGILLAMIVAVALKDWGEGEKTKEVVKSLALAGAVCLITLVVFEKFLMVPKDTYVSNDLPAAGVFVQTVFQHLGQYYALVVRDFKALWLGLMGMIGAGFIVLYTMQARQNKILAALVAVAGVAMMLMAVYAPYAALESPLYTTRAMYGIGAVLAVMGVYIVSCRGWKLVMAVPVVAISWCFYSFGFTYGNALGEQGRFRDQEINMVIADLNEILPELGEEQKYIQTTGQIDFAPSIQHLPARTQRMVRRLLKPSFGRDTYWMAYKLTEMSGLKKLRFSPEVDLREKNLPVLRQTELYIIYGDREGILVEFTGEKYETADYS